MEKPRHETRIPLIFAHLLKRSTRSYLHLTNAPITGTSHRPGVKWTTPGVGWNIQQKVPVPFPGRVMRWNDRLCPPSSFSVLSFSRHVTPVGKLTTTSQRKDLQRVNLDFNEACLKQPFRPSSCTAGNPVTNGRHFLIAADSVVFIGDEKSRYAFSTFRLLCFVSVLKICQMYWSIYCCVFYVWSFYPAVTLVR